VGGLDGRALRKQGIFQPIFGAQQMAILQPWENPELVRTNRNNSKRSLLGPSPPRTAAVWWFEDSRKYARPINRSKTTRVPRPKPSWPSGYPIIGWVQQKTGRSRRRSQSPGGVSGQIHAGTCRHMQAHAGTRRHTQGLSYHSFWAVAHMGAQEYQPRCSDEGGGTERL
jgi:hypothetical protein